MNCCEKVEQLMRVNTELNRKICGLKKTNRGLGDKIQQLIDDMPEVRQYMSKRGLDFKNYK